LVSLFVSRITKKKLLNRFSQTSVESLGPGKKLLDFDEKRVFNSNNFEGLWSRHGYEFDFG